MFNAIVQIKLCKVEGILAIVLMQHESCIMRHKRTERRREIVCCTDLASEVGKFDSTTAARDDSYTRCRISMIASMVIKLCAYHGWPWCSMQDKSNGYLLLGVAYTRANDHHSLDDPQEPPCQEAA